MPAPDPQDMQQWGTGIGAFFSGLIGSRVVQRFRRKDPMICVVNAIREEGDKTRSVLRENHEKMSELHSDIRVLLDRVPR